MNDIQARPAPRDHLRAMRTDLQVLAEHIGIRFMGFPGDARAAGYIADQFAAMGLQPRRQPFAMLGWRLLDDPRFEVLRHGDDAWSMPCFPYVYSASTSSQGYRGKLASVGRQNLLALAKFRPFERPKFQFRKYALIDGEGLALAHIVSRDFPVGASAAAWGVLPLPRTTPTVMIGEADGRCLEKMAAEGAEGYLRFATEFVPGLTSQNVLASLPGADERASEDQILVAAHYDTQYTGPGAVDNGSGVVAVLELARYLLKLRPRRTIVFALYGGEEVGFVGAKYHLDGLKENGGLRHIRAMVNLDMLACNQPNWIHASEDFLTQESVRRAARDLGIAEKYQSLEIVTPPWPSGDQDPFFEEGVPCVSFTWKGYKYPFTHTAEDTLDKVDDGVLLDSFHLARRVIEHIDAML